MIPKIVCIGSSTLDCIIRVHDVLRLKLFGKDYNKKYTAIEYSSKLNIEDVKFIPGGSAANIAANCSKLGLNSAYIGILGDDFLAQICLRDLKKRNVDISNVKLSSEDKTAFSVILKTYWGKDRSILAYKGANNLLRPSDINKDFFKKISAFAWTSLTSENGCKAIFKAINLTKENGGRVFAAPSISIIKNNLKWAKILISNSDVISLNKEDAQELTGFSEYEDIIQKFIEMGLKLVSITDGSNGSIISDGHKVITSSIYEVNVEDTTGAGDSFMSGIIYSSLNDYNLEKIAKVASAISAMKCMKLGIRDGLPEKIEGLNNFINSNNLNQHTT